MEKWRFKPCAPAIITGTIRSLANKMNELEALAQTLWKYREASIIYFTETWLHRVIPDTTVAGKKKGGGLVVLVNNR